MSITTRQYQKYEAALEIATSITPTPSITVTPSVTPSITITPSITPTISVTPSVTPSITVTPTPSPSVAYYYLANIFSCARDNSQQIICGQLTGQATIYSGKGAFNIGSFYSGSANTVYQPISVTYSSGANISVNSATSFNNCAQACSASLV